MGAEGGSALKRLWLFFWLTAALPLLAVDQDEAILSLLRTHLKGKGDHIERTVERIGGKTLRLESFISMEGDLGWFGRISSDVQQYSSWILNQINERPEGGTYPVQLTGLAKDSTDPLGLFAEMKLVFPLIKKTLRRQMRFVPNIKANRVRIDAEMPNLDDTMLSSGRAQLVFFPAQGDPGRLWGYVEGTIKIRNWLLYEALPTRILKRDAGERFLQIVNNYQAEENRRIRLNQIPKGKKATQGD